MLFWFIFPYLMFGHFIADFIFQSDKMALNKSKSNYCLTLYVVVYSWVFGFVCLPFFLWYFNFNVFFYKLLVYVYVNGFLHWITDYWTSRLTSYLYVKHRHWFFVAIGFDQWIHATCISITFYFSLWVINPT